MDRKKFIKVSAMAASSIFVKSGFSRTMDFLNSTNEIDVVIVGSGYVPLLKWV